MRSAREAYGSIAGRADGASGPSTIAPVWASASSRAVARSNSSHDGATPTQPRNGRPWIAIPGMSAERATPSSISQRTKTGRSNPSVSKPKPGRIAVVPKLPGSMLSISTTSRSPGRAPRTSIGPVSGWLAPSSTDSSVLASLSRSSCPSIPSRSSTTSCSPGSTETTGGRSGQMRLWLFAGLARIDLSASTLTWTVTSPRPPADAATMSAAPEASWSSSWLQSRGPESSCSEIIPSSRSSSRIAVTTWAAMP